MQFSRLTSALLGAGLAMFSQAALTIAAPFLVVENGANDVLRVDGNVRTVFASTGANSSPNSIARDPLTGDIFVSLLSGGGSILRYDSTGQSLGTFATVGGPTGLTIAGGKLYVSSASDSGLGGDGLVHHYDLTTATQVAVSNPSSVGGGLRGDAVAPDGTVYVSSLSDNTVRKIDILGNVTVIPLNGPAGLSIGPDGKLYAATFSGNIYRLNASNQFDFYGGALSPGEVYNINTDVLALAVAFSPDDGSLYTTDLSHGEVIRLQGPNGVNPGAQIETLTGFNGPTYITFVPVPEPTGLMLGGVALVLARRSRR